VSKAAILPLDFDAFAPYLDLGMIAVREGHMVRASLLLTAAALVALPAWAVALPARAEETSARDLAYCGRLADMYIRYIGDPNGSRHMGAVTPDAVGGSAVAKCRAGNTTDSIPVLERLLTNAGFTLPLRG
jgi:hypothetical protein